MCIIWPISLASSSDNLLFIAKMRLNLILYFRWWTRCWRIWKCCNACLCQEPIRCVSQQDSETMQRVPRFHDIRFPWTIYSKIVDESFPPQLATGGRWRWISGCTELIKNWNIVGVARLTISFPKFQYAQWSWFTVLGSNCELNSLKI